jgi:hypothetical protein
MDHPQKLWIREKMLNLAKNSGSKKYWIQLLLSDHLIDHLIQITKSPYHACEE